MSSDMDRIAGLENDIRLLKDERDCLQDEIDICKEELKALERKSHDKSVKIKERNRIITKLIEIVDYLMEEEDL